MSVIDATTARIDRTIVRATAGFDRLIGLAILRIILGLAGIEYYVSDYTSREYLWGPNSYDSMSDASQQLQHGAFSLYFISHSDLWFQFLFHLGLVVAVAFTIVGGRWLTLIHAVMLWSIYLRNQDILEGGDNIARILLLFMVFTVTNAYFAPGARGRRERLQSVPTTRAWIPLLHNAAVIAMLAQIAVLYFVSGYLKSTAEIWTNGTAMYYVSRIHQFSMFAWYPQAMNNVFLGWVVCYFTIIAEIAVPFVIWSKRATLRKMVTVSLEGMHFGIMAFMGLAAFGLIMIGADSMILTDKDYQAMARRVGGVLRPLRDRSARTAVGAPVDAAPAAVESHPTREKVSVG